MLVTQSGKSGRYMGYIKIDLDDLGEADKYDYRLLPVFDRFDKSMYDKKII